MNKKYWIERFVSLLFGTLGLVSVQSQDIHFSQVGNSPMNISPALTAVFSGDIRFVGNYKSQWESVPVPFVTFSGSYEMKFIHRKMPNSLIGGGVVFNYDKAGHGDLSLSQLGLNLAYTHRLTEKNFLTGGFQASMVQRMFRPAQLSFDSQYDGEQFRSDIVSGEVFNDPEFFYANFSTGLNWHFQQPGKRTRIDIGFALFNLNEAQQSFFNAKDIRLERRMNIYGIASFKLGERLDILPFGLFSKQDPYTEMVFGFSIKYFLNPVMTKELALQLGWAYRRGDAIIPTFELEFRKSLKLGLSYDVNTSGFSAATGRQGSPEFSLMYMINKVRPLEQSKICPLF